MKNRFGCLVDPLIVRCAAVMAAAWSAPSTVQAQTQWVADYELSVSNVMTMPMIKASRNPGEVQSTVVRPGLKAECPSGRILISHDSALRDADQQMIAQGTVRGRDLDNLTGPAMSATFNSPPNLSDRYHGADHDLVVLNNGDVLLVDATGSRVPIRAKPDWWDYAYRYFYKTTGLVFGPGARTSMLIYRSTDCGTTFQFLSEIDSAKLSVENDYSGLQSHSCGSPQPVDDLNVGNGEGYTGKVVPQGWPAAGATSPGSPEQPVYGLGGTDGPLTKVDVKTGRIYMTHRCDAFMPNVDDSTGFSLGDRINKMPVMVSYNGGMNWDRLGLAGFREWRADIVPVSPDLLVLEHGNYIALGRQTSPGNWDFSELGELPDYNDRKAGAGLLSSMGGRGIWASPVMSRVPGSPSKIMLAFQDKIDKGPLKRGIGYRIFFYDTAAHTFYEISDPILQQSNSPNSFVFHLAAIDIGEGPVLLYWSDFNTANGSVTVRGRLILSDTEYTSDFQVATVSKKAPNEYYFIPNAVHSWTWTSGYWYGDYHTAWGYKEPVRKQIGVAAPGEYPVISPSVLKPPAVWHFYPVWPEPSSKVRYTRVSVSRNWKRVSVPEGIVPPRISELTVKPPVQGNAQDSRARPANAQVGRAEEVQIKTVDTENWTVARSVDIGRLRPNAPELQPSVDYEKVRRLREGAESPQGRN